MQLRFLLLIPLRLPRTAPLVAVLTFPGKLAFWQTSSQSPGKELTSSTETWSVPCTVCAMGNLRAPYLPSPLAILCRPQESSPTGSKFLTMGALGQTLFQSALCHRHVYNPCCLFLFSIQPTLLSDTPEAPSTDCQPAPATGVGAGRAQAEAVHLLAQH